MPLFSKLILFLLLSETFDGFEGQPRDQKKTGVKNRKEKNEKKKERITGYLQGWNHVFERLPGFSLRK